MFDNNVLSFDSTKLNVARKWINIRIGENIIFYICHRLVGESSFQLLDVYVFSVTSIMGILLLIDIKQKMPQQTIYDTKRLTGSKWYSPFKNCTQAKNKRDLFVYCLTFCRAQEKMNNVKWIHCHRQLIANFVICYETSSQKKEEGGERDEGKRRRLLNKF